MVTIIKFIYSTGHAAFTACRELTEAVYYVFTPPGEEPTSHSANEGQTGLFGITKSVIKKWGTAIKELFLKKIGAEEFEKTISKRKLLNSDYSYCAAEKDKGMPQAMYNLLQLHAQVVCLFRAGFMPLELPNPNQNPPLLFFFEEKMREKLYINDAAKTKSQLLIASTLSELGETSTAISNLLVKVVLNSSIDLSQSGISQSLKVLKTPFDITNSSDYNKQAESILIKLTLVLAKMHALKGVDISDKAAQSDILTELKASFRNILKLEENTHYLLVYQRYLASIKQKPSVEIKSSTSLYQWSLYVLINHREQLILPRNDSIGDGAAFNPINVGPLSPSKIIKGAAIQESINRHRELNAAHKAFLKPLSVPQRPVVMLNAPDNTDFASNLTMPNIIYARNTTICVAQGSFLNQRIIYPYINKISNAILAMGMGVGPTKHVLAHFARGPRPPIEYHLLDRKGPGLGEVATSRLHSIYSLTERPAGSNRAMLEAYAITSGNTWAVVNKYKEAANVDVSQLRGQGLIGGLWDVNTFYGLACQIGRYRVQITLGEPTAERALVNRNYAKALLSDGANTYRDNCVKLMIINSAMTVGRLNSSMSINPLIEGSLASLTSEIALAFLGIQYHFYLLRLDKSEFPIKSVDLQYLEFFQKFSLYFLDSRFRKEFSDPEKTPEKALKSLKVSVTTERLLTKANLTAAALDEQKILLDKLKVSRGLISLSPKEKEITFLVEQFMSIIPPRTPIRVEDIQAYFYNQNGYTLSISANLKRSIDNCISEQACKNVMGVLQEDLDGYNHAITVLNAVPAPHRPKDLFDYFSFENINNQELSQTIQKQFQDSINELSVRCPDRRPNSNSGSVADDTPLPQSASFSALSLRLSRYKESHWYSLNMLLATVPEQFRNRVFINMLGLLFKIMDNPDYEKNPLSIALYSKSKPSTEVLKDLKASLSSEASGLMLDLNVDIEEEAAAAKEFVSPELGQLEI